MGISYITVTSGDGSFATVISKSDLKMQNFNLDLTTSPSATLLGSYVSPLYLVLWVDNNNDRFIQIHNIFLQNKPLIGTVDAQVTSYQVLDLLSQKSLFLVYAISVTPDASVFLNRVTIRYDTQSRVSTTGSTQLHLPVY